VRAGVAYHPSALDQTGEQQHASEASSEPTGDGGAADLEPWHLYRETKVILNDILKTHARE